MRLLQKSVLKKRLNGFIFMLIVLLSASWLYAEDMNKTRMASQKTASESIYKLQEIIVTAQKQKENVQDVPISLDVFTDTQMEDAGIEKISDVARLTPNMYLKQASPESTIILRGVSTFHSAIHTPCGFYLDDVNLPMQYMHNNELFDIMRIEILKGPQGTLYGRNSESGVVNILTRQPNNELRGKIFGEYGFYDTSYDNVPSYRVGGNVSGPIIKDKLYFAVVGMYKDSNGYIKNEYLDDDKAGSITHKNFRGTLRWTPTEKWDLSLIADAFDADDGYGLYRLATGVGKTDRYTFNADYPENYICQDGNGQTLRVKYKGDFFDVISILGLRKYKNHLAGDRDISPQPRGTSIFFWEDEQISQELRLSSPENHGVFQWLAGLYGFKEETDTRINLNMPGQGPIWDHLTNIENKSYAVFGQVTYTFFDKLHLTAGLRYDGTKVKGELNGKPSMMSPAGQRLSNSRDYDEILPKFVTAYDFTPEIMGYASASKGYLIGGYNYVSAFSEQAFPYDCEYTWNYEMGVKTSWLDKRILANLAVFYIDIRDKQVFEIDTSVPIPGAQNIRNASQAHSSGFELEIQARPVKGLDLFAGFGYTQALFDDWLAPAPGGIQVDYENKNLPYVPKYTYTLGAQYRHMSGLFGRIDLSGTGSYYYDSINVLEQEAYQSVNIRLGYEWEKMTLTLWGKNVFDEKYYNYMTHYGPDTLVVDGEPRMFGLTLTYRF